MARTSCSGVRIAAGVFFITTILLISFTPTPVKAPQLRGVESDSGRDAHAKVSAGPIAAPGQMQMQIPPILYGTAWKKGRTKSLVEAAILAGFRGVDTACQPKHYLESGVGEALQSLYAQGVVTRADLFLQTKFTSLGGQDPQDVPYDKDAPLAEQ
ncbi:hypothetical protein B484DRAFT_394353, partial [Ochromonadaceae sp. CCMP2298]